LTPTNTIVHGNFDPKKRLNPKKNKNEFVPRIKQMQLKNVFLIRLFNLAHKIYQPQYTASVCLSNSKQHSGTTSCGNLKKIHPVAI
jgi:hypothetical protein